MSQPAIWSLLTLLFIVTGAASYAYAVIRFMRKTEARKDLGPSISEILRAQSNAADNAARLRISIGGFTLEEFLDAFARQLMLRWNIAYDEAYRLGVEMLDECEMRFPDPQYDWSPTAARELADIYADENGEHYGSNE